MTMMSKTAFATSRRCSFWALFTSSAVALVAMYFINRLQETRPKNHQNTDSATTTTSSSIVVAILPDTQYYAEGAPYIYKSQTSWLASFRENAFTIHAGDLVQSANAQAQWQVASQCMSELDTYSVSAGNHDLANDAQNDTQRRRSHENYLKWFSPEHASKLPTFGGRDPLGYSEYHLFTNEGMTFLVLSLDWRVSSQTLGWARQVLHNHSRTPAIVMSHEYMYKTMDGSVLRSDYGDALWNTLRDCNSVFFIICGHISASGHRVDVNNFGQEVVSVLVDYQEEYAGGTGYMRLVELDFNRSTMEHLTFSPHVMNLYAQQGVDALSPNDVAERTLPADKYTVGFDFVKRFEAIQAKIPPTLIHHAGESKLNPLRDVLDSIPPPRPRNIPHPRGPMDYPLVQETLAHWRFEGKNNTPVVETVEDISRNGNNLHKMKTSFYLNWSSDHHELSASPGSICFSNPNRTVGSFLKTIANAPLASETFDHGFTIEAFVKMPSDGAAPWAGVLSRDALGKDAGKTMGDLNEPLAALGFSPSAEVQFQTFPAYQQGIVTAWSSPLELDTWHHVAVINTGHSTRLYLNGYRARRDPVHDGTITGISTAEPGGWIIGASRYDQKFNVFRGCIGEVRIVGRALKPSHFLIERAKRPQA